MDHDFDGELRDAFQDCAARDTIRRDHLNGTNAGQSVIPSIPGAVNDTTKSPVHLV